MHNADYTTEYEVENKFIDIIKRNWYTFSPISSYEDLVQNFRVKLNQLNQDILGEEELSNTEFKEILMYLESKNIFDASQLIRENAGKGKIDIIKRNDYNHETSQVIVGCRGNCGAIQLTNTKSWINGNAMVIKPLNNIKLIYLYYLMHTIRFDKIIEKSSVPQITRDKMKTIKIPANFDNRILDMLILLDKKIELLQKEVKVFKKIKLQLLNVLFI